MSFLHLRFFGCRIAFICKFSGVLGFVMTLFSIWISATMIVVIVEYIIMSTMHAISLSSFEASSSMISSSPGNERNGKRTNQISVSSAAALGTGAALNSERSFLRGKIDQSAA